MSSPFNKTDKKSTKNISFEFTDFLKTGLIFNVIYLSLTFSYTVQILQS
jgi:hypothetical protein